MLNCRQHCVELFLIFFLDNDEKVTSSQKHTHIKVRVQKNHTLFMTKMAKIS